MGWPPAVVRPACPPARSKSEKETGIYSLSHPHGQALRISAAGKRVAAAELDWKTQMAFTSEIHGGSSGGGVYDAQTGHLLALISHSDYGYSSGTHVKAIWRDALLRSTELSVALYDDLTRAVAASNALDRGHYAAHIERLASRKQDRLNSLRLLRLTY